MYESGLCQVEWYRGNNDLLASQVLLEALFFVSQKPVFLRNKKTLRSDYRVCTSEARVLRLAGLAALTIEPIFHAGKERTGNDKEESVS